MTSENLRDRRVLVGRVLGAHGVRGLVRIESYMGKPEEIGAVTALADEAGRPINLTLAGTVRGGLLAQVEGVATRDAAEELSGRTLWVPRACLPEPEEGALYASDLIGLVVLEGNVKRGKVVDVADFGAGPLVEVEPAGRRRQDTVYLPFTEPIVTEIDLAGGTLRVDLPQGLWPED
jgi:16S rRNA processing protein RimM